jgi:hypothetical protein
MALVLVAKKHQQANRLLAYYKIKPLGSGSSNAALPCLEFQTDPAPELALARSPPWQHAPHEAVALDEDVARDAGKMQPDESRERKTRDAVHGEQQL